MPYSPRTGLPRLGQTYYKGQTPPTTFAESASAEGTLAVFKDNENPGAVGAGTVRSNHDVVKRLVRNVSGATLATKRLVSWKTGYIGKRVDGYTDLDYDLLAAGVIDERLTAGCPANDLCWITVQGPTLVKTSLAADATAVIDENDRIAALTGANSTATTSGRVQAIVLDATTTAENDLSSLRVMGIIGRALSAKTTSQTDNDILAYIDLLKA